jgi:hypothetical protein
MKEIAFEARTINKHPRKVYFLLPLNNLHELVHSRTLLPGRSTRFRHVLTHTSSDRELMQIDADVSIVLGVSWLLWISNRLQSLY